MDLVFVAPANSIHTLKWVSFFCDIADVRITLITFDEVAYDFPHNCNVLQYPKTSLSAFSPSLRIRLKEADVVHVHSLGFYGAATWLSGATEFIGTAWGTDIVVGRKSIFRSILLRRVLSHCKLVTCDSPHMREKILDLRQNSVVELINFGVDTQKFCMPAENHKNEAGPVILSTRNFEPVYDIPTAISGFERFSKEYPGSKLRIIGSGSLEETVNQQVAESPVKDAITLVGRISQEQMVAELQGADVYVSASLADGGIAASTAEAMACGLIPVVSEVGDNDHWVKEGETGALFSTGNPESLSFAIKRVVEATNFEQLRVNARALILEKNDFRGEMLKMLKLYGS